MGADVSVWKPCIGLTKPQTQAAMKYYETIKAELEKKHPRTKPSIGYLDLEMQQKTLALYLEELERAIEQLRREEPEKKRLCWGLGILGGLFLAVVLM